MTSFDVSWWRMRRILAVVLALILTGAAARVRADDDDRGFPTPPRLGFFDGDVSFWRPGAEDWAPAQVNTALAAGDSLYAGAGGSLELQIGPRAFIRAGAETEVALASLEPDYMQFKVTGGHAALDFKRLPSGLTVEIDTPSGAFTVDRAGYYRVNVDDNSTTFNARRGGVATLVPANGEETDVGENQQVVLEGTEDVQVHASAAADLDQWDRWNYDRMGSLGEAPRSAQYVPPDVAGVDDLDRYGDWRDTPRYGHVWVPRDVRPDWAPYSSGRWVYDPYYEWTWVDEAPWGWCPYHYGRWVNFDGYWGWAPGPVIVARPVVYAPALVAFFGAPGVGVAVSVGGPAVSWVALGFGEPVVPWWGGNRFAGRPYWGGWGGPRVVNNVVVNNTTVVNVTNITKFQNVTVRNAVVGVDHFGRGRAQYARFDAQAAERLRPLHGRLDVKPAPASLVAREGRGHRPPERMQTRQVVATRPAQDHTRRLREQGLQVAAPTAPQSRVVKAQRGPHRGPGGRPEHPLASGEQPNAGDRERPGHAGRPERPGTERLGRQHPGGAEAPEHAIPAPPRSRGEHGAPRVSRPGGERETPPPPHSAREERQGRERGTPPPRAGRQERPGRMEPQSRGEEPERAAPPPPREHSRGGRPETHGRPGRPDMERGTPAPPSARLERPGSVRPERTRPSASRERPPSPDAERAMRPPRAMPQEHPNRQGEASRERPGSQAPDHQRATPPGPESRARQAPAPHRSPESRTGQAPPRQQPPESRAHKAPGPQQSGMRPAPRPGPTPERAARSPREAPRAQAGRERRPRHEPES